MSGATAEDYAWLDEKHDDLRSSGFCIALVKGLSPRETFDRLTIPPADTDEYRITAAAAATGTVLVEVNGFSATLADVARRLSQGTAVAAVYVNVNLDQNFVFAADGEIVAEFEPDYPETDAELLLPHMRDLGMPVDDDTYPEDWGDPILTALALAERVTGVRPASPHISTPDLVGSAEHLY